MYCKNCMDCGKIITPTMYMISMKNHKKALCVSCQKASKENTNHAQYYSKLIQCKPRSEPITKKEPTREAQLLSDALNNMGIKTNLEQWDGFKHIDIAIKSVKLNIEVDGKHHQSPKQALADLKRVCFSSVKGYETIRIPNSLVKKDLEEVADWIKELVQNRRSKTNRKKKY